MAQRIAYGRQKRQRACIIPCMNADGLPGALVQLHFAADCNGVVEISCAVNGQTAAKLFARERKLWPDPFGLDREVLGVRRDLLRQPNGIYQFGCVTRYCARI